MTNSLSVIFFMGKNLVLLLFVDGTETPNQTALYDLIKIIGAIAAILAIIAIIYKIGVFVQKQIGKMEHLEDDAMSNIKPSIDKVDNKIETKVIPVIADINVGVSYLRGVMDNMNVFSKGVTNRTSPLVLNDVGEKILTDSGIDIIINNNYKIISDKVKDKNPFNAYQAQETIKEVVKELINDDKLKDVIETGAFNCGSDVTTVLFVGAIYIRDKIMGELNLYPEDIDTYDPDKNK